MPSRTFFLNCTITNLQKVSYHRFVFFNYVLRKKIHQIKNNYSVALQ